MERPIGETPVASGRWLFGFDKTGRAWQLHPALAAGPASARDMFLRHQSLFQGEFDVAKPEWGIKRTCQSCGAVFYDLRRDPITCPKCGTQHDPEAVLKSRRSRPAVADEPKVVPLPVPVPVEAEAVEAPEADKEAAEEEEEAAVIEDTSDLGEDEDDLGEVMENVDPNEKD